MGMNLMSSFIRLLLLVTILEYEVHCVNFDICNVFNPIWSTLDISNYVFCQIKFSKVEISKVPSAFKDIQIICGSVPLRDNGLIPQLQISIANDTTTLEYPGGINFICWTVQDNVRSRDIFRNTIIIHIYFLFLTWANHTFSCTEIQGMPIYRVTHKG